MKLQAIHTIIRRSGKTEKVHNPNDRDKGIFECPEDEGEKYVAMGAARKIEDDKSAAKKSAAKKAPAKKAAAKTDAVDPAAVAGQSGATGDETETDEGTGDDTQGGENDDDMLG